MSNYIIVKQAAIQQIKPNSIASQSNMLQMLKYALVDYWYQVGDPEANDFFWTVTPWPTLLATVAYLYIVLKAGPDFMRHRKPYDPKLAIRIYNLLLVAINTYLFFGSLFAFNYGIDVWGCGESLKRDSATLYWGNLFFHTRYLEFFDTFFFILRKKDSQISFLHVFHHGVVPILMYLGLKFYPLPANYLLPITNKFVHIIMYLYYGLASFGPKIQKYLWWKQYLTTLQISQFALLFLHTCQPLIFANDPTCKFPIGMILFNGGISLTFLSLFVSFYRRTYCSNKLRDTRNGIKSKDVQSRHEPAKMK